MEEKNFALAWQILLSGYSKKFWELIKYFGLASEAWLASEKELFKSGCFKSEKLAEIINLRSSFSFKHWTDILAQNKIKYVYYNDLDYPQILKNIYDPPTGIFVKGDLEAFKHPMVAFVGGRNSTSYGVLVAKKLSSEVSRAGVTVVSGLAKGIDSAAHLGALEGDGYTIAVLGCGVDVVYPKENKNLMEKILDKGALMSEFPPGAFPYSWHFPIRNRIISGLCRAVVVVESAKKSGSLITAELALEQGKEVMAVPGNIFSPMSYGCNNLIKQGASLITSSEDILNSLGIKILIEQKSKKNSSLEPLSENENELLKHLSLEPMAMDILINRTSLPTEQIISNLMILELKGIIKKLPGEFYVKMDY